MCSQKSSLNYNNLNCTLHLSDAAWIKRKFYSLVYFEIHADHFKWATIYQMGDFTLYKIRKSRQSVIRFVHYYWFFLFYLELNSFNGFIDLKYNLNHARLINLGLIL